MEKQSKKKGFTLVELLVVIAILAILASVSVVGYLSFTEKANKSVDEQLCTQYNTLLKAQNVLDEDITLPELVTLIEENGINTNQFGTSSKSYVFAYDRKNISTVLLDKETGSIAFPVDYTSDVELWGVYPDGGRLQVGIYNYALLSPVTLKSSLTMTSNKEYTFDLNNNLFELGNELYLENITKLNLTNGPFIVPSGTSKVEGDSTTVSIGNDSDDSKFFTDGNFVVPENHIVTSGNTITIENKYYASNYYIPNSGRSGGISLTYGEGYTVYIKNVYFANCTLTLNGGAHYIIDGCQFYNMKDNNAITATAENISYEIKNNKIINSTKSINTMMPGNSRDRIIENNEFYLSAIETNKDERKDNAIKITLDKPNSVNSGTGKLIIRSNKVNKALGFISLHEGWVNDTTLTKERKIELLSTRVDFIDNYISNGVEKVTADPGIKNDTEKYELLVSFAKELVKNIK